MSNITMKSNELQRQKVQEESIQVVTRWKKHFDGDIQSRIPISALSVQSGLEDRRFFVMKKHVDELLLIAVIAKQIEDLKSFLNLKSNFNSNQILDTAEIILQKYDDMSFTALMDCFSRIKTANPPFNGKLYESIDGRKVFEFLDTYRNYQIDYLENAHLDRKASSDFALDDLKNADPKVVESLSKLTEKIRVDAILNKPEYRSTFKQTESEELVQEWIQEFHQLTVKEPEKVPAGGLEEFLESKMRAYNETRTVIKIKR